MSRTKFATFSLRLLAAFALFAFAIESRAIVIDTVPIGNLGNASDPSDGDTITSGVQHYGSVSYAYRIGKYEVTIGQYAAFLNAVAATDTNALYHANMSDNLNTAGITRNGTSGSYSYTTFGSPNRPITYVNYGDAVRFVNWLHNGQPGLNGPPVLQNAQSTEGGAYTLSPTSTNNSYASITRNAAAQWFLPNENEWYKAAYYQPASNGGDSDDYWLYPTRSNTLPHSDQPPGVASIQTNVGNVFRDDSVANGIDDGYAVTGSTVLNPNLNYLTDVGAYSQSPSYYGTFDQGGNVYEIIDTLNFMQFPGGRVIRGGSWDVVAEGMHSSQRGLASGVGHQPHNGFRVGTFTTPVPEPSTFALAAIAGGMLFAMRRRFTSTKSTSAQCGRFPGR